MIRSNCGLVTKKPPIHRDVPPKKLGQSNYPPQE